MKEKKTERADLENKRTLFFLTGMAVILFVFYQMLEWRSPVDEYGDLGLLSPYFIETETEEGIVPETRQAEAANNDEENKAETRVGSDDYNIVDKSQEIIDDKIEMKPLEKDSTMILLPTSTLNDLVHNNLQISAQNSPAIVTAQPAGMPQFPGGNIAMIRFIHQNLQYPSVALKQRIQGRVWCSFVVEKDGSISDLKLEKGLYSFLDEEALRVLRLMPQWIPAVRNNSEVAVRVYIPIVFKL